MFKWNLNEISRGRYKSEELKSALENIKSIYESWKSLIKLFNNYFLIVSEAKSESIYGKELRILTLKQLFQRLPIVLAPVKSGNTSENLLNRIRQIMYHLHQAKEITKKVFNNIANSIKI